MFNAIADVHRREALGACSSMASTPLQPFRHWLAKCERALTELLDRMDTYLKALERQGELQ